MPLGYPYEVRKCCGKPIGASRRASRRNVENKSPLAAAFTQGKRLAHVSAACRNMENT